MTNSKPPVDDQLRYVTLNGADTFTTMPVPANPKIYHIVHVDRLASILAECGILCDAEVLRRGISGTVIGLDNIKQRRLQSTLTSHQGLHVGECVPFYFCPRSVMLYVINKGNMPGLAYRGGQAQVLHLEADLRSVVAWANAHKKRWAFTLTNAGSYYFKDRNDLAQLSDIDWAAVQATQWSGNGISPDIREHKQAEFLLEERFPWELIERIGVLTAQMYSSVEQMIQLASHKPKVERLPNWYYL